MVFLFYIKNVQTVEIDIKRKKLRKSCIFYSKFIFQHQTFLIYPKLEFSMEESTKEKRKPHTYNSLQDVYALMYPTLPLV